MEILLEHMKRLHNKELLLSGRESQKCTEMLIARSRDGGPPLPFSPHIGIELNALGTRINCRYVWVITLSMFYRRKCTKRNSLALFHQGRQRDSRDRHAHASLGQGRQSDDLLVPESTR